MLEALYLHFKPDTPEAPWNVNHSRGVRGNLADSWQELVWLFYAKQSAASIELISKNSQEKNNALRIRLVEPEERLLVPTETDGAEQTNVDMLAAVAQSSVLKLEYTDHTGKDCTSQAHLVPGGISSSSFNNPPSSNVALVLKNPRFSEEHAQRYSSLVEAGREEELLPSLQALDPRIRRLELLYPANKPMLYVDIGQLVPLLYMGEGLGYVLSWQLAVMTAKDGTVLIDEFENGLHYSAQVDAWKAVGAAARQSNVQVFATTHSWECVKAARRAFAESDEDDFRLHRLERRDGEVVALTYDQEQLDTAIEFNFEVR